MRNEHAARKTRDALLMAASALAAIALLQSGVLKETLFASDAALYLSSFIAGALFTSLFTVPFSLVLFGELAGTASPWFVAFWGSLGSVLADLVLFAVVRVRLNPFLIHAFGGRHHDWLRRVFRYRTFRIVAPALGAFAIASPLPDELGLTLMGLARARLSVVAALSFVLHFAGILALMEGLEALVTA